MAPRIVIDDVRPRTPSEVYPAKAVVGERVDVSADVFRDGHDELGVRVQWRHAEADVWLAVSMTHIGNDRWHGWFTPTAGGPHVFVVEAWTDRYQTWRRGVEAKVAAGQDVATELAEGALLLDEMAECVPEAHRRRFVDAARSLRSADCAIDVRLNAGLDDAIAAPARAVPDPADHTTSPEWPLWVDRPLARFGAWYEMFPRSEGGLDGSRKRLPAIAAMGFDIVYLPPIHPIGTTARKGPGNTLDAGADDPGSPWAIGSPDGGHTAVHPDLGSIEDFDEFAQDAADHGLAVALDYALQCSPDHPWVTEHPEWFHHRPDGTIKYAENPPKKYQDIYPLDFWPPDDRDRAALWEACEAILRHWVDHGVTIFRVDNPHTKPLAFWAWMIPRIQADHPDTILLAEAFTMPKMMAKLAEVGFTQSYTYFTWRTSKGEIEQYVRELGHGLTADYMRPNFWPNTPDILSGPLRHGSPAAFRIRLVLAALLSPAYGIYSGYELVENEPADDSSEEYLHSEKYEIKARDWDDPTSLSPLVTNLNDFRRSHPACAELRTIAFHRSNHDELIAWSKTDHRGDVVLVIVNLDPDQAHETTMDLDLGALGVSGRFEVHDSLSGDTFTWDGPNPYIRLDPADQVAHVLHVRHG